MDVHETNAGLKVEPVGNEAFFNQTIMRLDATFASHFDGFMDYRTIRNLRSMDELKKMARAIKRNNDFKDMRYNDIFSVLIYIHYKEYAKRNTFLSRANISLSFLEDMADVPTQAYALLEAIQSNSIYVGLFDPLRFTETYNYGGFDIIILLVVHSDVVFNIKEYGVGQFDVLQSDTCTIMEAMPSGTCNSSSEFQGREFQAIIDNIYELRDNHTFLQSLQTSLRQAETFTGWNIVKDEIHNRRYTTDERYKYMIVVYAEDGPYETGQQLNVREITSRRTLLSLLDMYKAPLILDTSGALCGDETKGHYMTQYEKKMVEYNIKDIAYKKRESQREKALTEEIHEDMTSALTGVLPGRTGEEEFDCVILVDAHGGCDKSGDVIPVDAQMKLSVMRSSCFGNVSYGRNYPQRVSEMINAIRRINPSKIAIFEGLQRMFRNRKNRNAKTRPVKGTAADDAERSDPGWVFGINGSHFYNTHYEYDKSAGFRDSITVVYSNRPEFHPGAVIPLEEMSLSGLVKYLHHYGFKNPAVIEDVCHSIHGCPVEDAKGIMNGLIQKYQNLIGGKTIRKKMTRKYKSKKYFAHRNTNQNRRRGT